MDQPAYGSIQSPLSQEDGFDDEQPGWAPKEERKCNPTDNISHSRLKSTPPTGPTQRQGQESSGFHRWPGIILSGATAWDRRPHLKESKLHPLVSQKA